jgi:hypothetical protein
VALETIPAFVDFVVQGEGERAILDIVEGRAAERVLRCRRIDNLDDLPIPAWDYLIDQPYIGGGDWFPGTPVFTMNTSRGCPFPAPSAPWAPSGEENIHLPVFPSGPSRGQQEPGIPGGYRGLSAHPHLGVPPGGAL